MVGCASVLDSARDDVSLAADDSLVEEASLIDEALDDDDELWAALASSLAALSVDDSDEDEAADERDAWLSREAEPAVAGFWVGQVQNVGVN